MTCMRAGTSFNFSPIGPPTAELAALERLKIPNRLIIGKGCLHFFAAVLDRIFFILAGNDNIHESLDEFEIWLDLTTVFHGNRSKKLMILFFLVCYLSNPF